MGGAIGSVDLIKLHFGRILLCKRLNDTHSIDVFCQIADQLRDTAARQPKRPLCID